MAENTNTKTNAPGTTGTTAPPKAAAHGDDKPEPNIAFVGKPVFDEADENPVKSERKILRENAPIEKVLGAIADKTGKRVNLELPDAAEQIEAGDAGFFHENAATIKKAFPHLYKTPVEKGKK